MRRLLPVHVIGGGQVRIIADATVRCAHNFMSGKIMMLGEIAHRPVALWHRSIQWNWSIQWNRSIEGTMCLQVYCARSGNRLIREGELFASPPVIGDIVDND